MGLLNHLFGGKKGLSKEVAYDEQKRFTLWQQHLADYPKREALAKFFNFANVNNAVANWVALDAVLQQIAGLISRDLVEISDEEKADAEILADLASLTKGERSGDSHAWHSKLAESYKKQEIVLKIMRRIHDVLVLELETIRRIRQRPANATELLGYLFRLIFHQETYLYRALSAEGYFDKSVAEQVNKITQNILLEHELEKEVVTDEMKFIQRMVKIMGNTESSHNYRKLGEDIYLELAERAGAPMARGQDLTVGIQRLERLLQDNNIMFAIVKARRPRYSDNQVRWTVQAFRKAYDLNHFEELENEFAT